MPIEPRLDPRLAEALWRLTAGFFFLQRCFKFPAAAHLEPKKKSVCLSVRCCHSHALPQRRARLPTRSPTMSVASFGEE